MKWISVNDRLPDNLGEEVLGYNGFDPKYYQRRVTSVFFRNNYFKDQTGITLHGISHWMALPSEPLDKEEEEEFEFDTSVLSKIDRLKFMELLCSGVKIKKV